MNEEPNNDNDFIINETIPKPPETIETQTGSNFSIIPH